MSKWLKRIAALIGGLILIVVLLVIALPLLIDPNRFKGPIENLAREQGFALQLAGPISWQFYPDLGLSMEGVSLAPAEQPGEVLARLEKGVAAVQLMPLFSGQVRVRDVVVDGAQVQLRVDENGRGNWELLSQGGENASTESSSEGGGQDLDFSMESLHIRNTALSYEDAQSQQRFDLDQIELSLEGVNLERRPIPITGSFRLRSNALSNSPNAPAGSGSSLEATADIKSSIAVEQAMQNLSVGDTQLTLRFPDRDDAAITLALQAEATLEPTLSYSGNVAVEPFNAAAVLQALGQQLPDMQDPNALQRVALSGNFSGSDQQANLSNLQFTLDDTTLQGELGWQQRERNGTAIPSIKVRLRGNELNADRYMAPTEETAATASAPSSTATGTAPASTEDTPLPLEELRSLDLDLQLDLEKLTAMNMPVGKPSLKVLAEAGHWQLQSLTGEFYQGTLQAAGELDARKDGPAPLQFAAQLKDLAVQPLLQELADFGDISGNVTGDLMAKSRAQSVNQLIKELNATFVFNSPNMVLQGINVEQYYCQMASRLNEEDAPEGEWPKQTAISEVQGKLSFADSQLTIDALRAALGNLIVQGKGFANIDSDRYEVRLPMLLAGESTSAEGCRIDSNFLLSHEVDVVGCKGSLENLALGEQCGLDSGAVTTLAKQALRYNAQKRIEPKKEELRSELKEKLQEKLGEEDAESARDLLRNLLKR